jgi:[ribosomal protein S5]-alanine N-acetyltransferase
VSVIAPTERLSFRSWREDDDALAWALWGDPRVVQFISRGALSAEEVRARLAAEIACEREHGVSYWPMFLRDGGAFVGVCGLHPRGDQELELGFHLLPEHWGKGLAVEAARAAIAYAFDRLRVGSLFAGHHPENEGSRRVLAKLGFHAGDAVLFEGTGLMHAGYRLESFEQMLICVDVDYAPAETRTACVGFHGWQSEGAAHEWVDRSSEVAAPYRAGRFFERELPFVLGAVSRLKAPPAAMIVDGYVELGPGKPGLGARLHEAMESHPVVIGVAKKAFAGAPSVEVLRGRSKTPLYVTAVGVDAAVAAGWVKSMHGAHRLPTLLQRVDHLARGMTRPGA